MVDEDEVDHADMVSSFDDFNPPDMELPEDSAGRTLSDIHKVFNFKLFLDSVSRSYAARPGASGRCGCD